MSKHLTQVIVRHMRATIVQFKEAGVRTIYSEAIASNAYKYFEKNKDVSPETEHTSMMGYVQIAGRVLAKFFSDKPEDENPASEQPELVDVEGQPLFLTEELQEGYPTPDGGFVARLDLTPMERAWNVARYRKYARGYQSHADKLEAEGIELLNKDEGDAA